MKIPEIKIDFKKLLSAQKDSDWKKAIYFILLLVTLFYIVMLAYLFLKPASPEVTEQVKTEIPTDAIKINENVIESIKAKEYPN